MDSLMKEDKVENMLITSIFSLFIIIAAPLVNFAYSPTKSNESQTAVT